MIVKTLEFIAEMFGLKEPDLSGLERTRLEFTPATFPADSLRYSPNYQHHVFAPTVRAKELAIHLREKYGENWQQNISKIPSQEKDSIGETPEVIRELSRIDLKKPVVSMTPDGVPVVQNGFHTVCAYRNQGYTTIPVLLGTPYNRTSEELGVRTFDQLVVYPHL